MLHERPSLQRLQFDPLSFLAGTQTFTYSSHVYGESAEGPAFVSATEDGDVAAHGMQGSGEQGGDVHFDRRSGGTCSRVGAEQRILRQYGRGSALRAHLVRLHGAFRPTPAAAAWTLPEVGECANLQVHFEGRSPPHHSAVDPVDSAPLPHSVPAYRSERTAPKRKVGQWTDAQMQADIAAMERGAKIRAVARDFDIP